MSSSNDIIDGKNLTIDERVALVNEVGEEVTTQEELRELLLTGRPEDLIAYDGFEPSGQVHIAQGILRTININKMIKAGCTFKMLIGDWHALANNKLGGNLENIQTAGKYFIEVWKACGMDLNHVEFHWASDYMKDDSYWLLVLQIAKTNKVKRFVRTAEIMGREESDELSLAQLIYPAMQAADIFLLGARITQLGMDQRKVNMLGREIGPQLGFWKPIVVSHHMLLGLGKPATETTDTKKRAIELKMSKSKPETAIFMTDSLEDVTRKINNAWCPEGVTTENPILEYCKYILFEKYPVLVIERPEKWGGRLEFHNFEDLERAFANKEVHPMDLKQTVIKLLDELLQPVRAHFENNAEANALLEKVKSFATSR